MPELKKIALGSGYVYLAEFTGTVPDKATLAVEANLLGYISGGAELEYKSTFYTVNDDMGHIKEDNLISEEATFKTGVLTYNAATLNKLCSTGTLVETATMRTLEIGGIANDNKKKYVFLFEHEDVVKGNTRIYVVGRNQSGFVIKFVKDKETIIDVTINANPLNDKGNLVRYEEDIPAA